MIDEWTLRWTTTRSPPCARARQSAWLPPDAAVDEEPAPLRAPGVGGQPLRELERGLRRVRADVDPLDPGRDVEQQRRLADRLAKRRVGARAALVAGDVEAPGIAPDVVDERVEVGRLVLIHRLHRIEAGRPRAALAQAAERAAQADRRRRRRPGSRSRPSGRASRRCRPAPRGGPGRPPRTPSSTPSADGGSSSSRRLRSPRAGRRGRRRRSGGRGPELWIRVAGPKRLRNATRSRPSPIRHQLSDERALDSRSAERRRHLGRSLAEPRRPRPACPGACRRARCSRSRQGGSRRPGRPPRACRRGRRRSGRDSSRAGRGRRRRRLVEVRPVRGRHERGRVHGDAADRQVADADPADALRAVEEVVAVPVVERGLRCPGRSSRSSGRAGSRSTSGPRSRRAPAR